MKPVELTLLPGWCDELLSRDTSRFVIKGWPLEVNHQLFGKALKLKLDNSKSISIPIDRIASARELDLPSPPVNYATQMALSKLKSAIEKKRSVSFQFARKRGSVISSMLAEILGPYEVTDFELVGIRPSLTGDTYIVEVFRDHHDPYAQLLLGIPLNQIDLLSIRFGEP